MEVFADILYFPIGWIYLWIRYRNKEKIKQVLKEDYEDSYYVAGAQLVWSAFGILLFTILIIFLLVVIGRALFDAFS